MIMMHEITLAIMEKNHEQFLHVAFLVHWLLGIVKFKIGIEKISML
jgi:hypothetical protein